VNYKTFGNYAYFIAFFITSFFMVQCIEMYLSPYMSVGDLRFITWCISFALGGLAFKLVIES
jgi:hypothetical protein